MIIDIHAHINLLNPFGEKEIESLLADMDRFGIEKRVVSAIHGGNIKKQNDCIVDLVKKHPDRLIGCAVINPKDENAIEESQRILKIPEIRMIEFNSLEHGYYPDACKRLDEILTVLSEKDLPIKVFAGIGARSMPQQWLKQIKKHRNVNFIILHMACFDYGYGCVDLAKEHENVYLETSNQYEVQIIKKAINELSPEKLLFGSLYPERFTRCSISIFDTFDVDSSFRKRVYEENAKNILKFSGGKE